MTTLAYPSAVFASAPSMAQREQRFTLYDLTWENYINIGNQLPDRPGLRLTYDRGTLEFMTTSPRNERYKRWLGRFVETIAEELQKPIMPGGSMTFQREDLDRGFEPDDCVWIANESAVREKLTWEPAIDPPPDVALEIEISRSAMNRMVILASFRIPEVWCYDGDVICVYLLQADGTYLVSEHCLAFPTIPVKELARFFPPSGNSDFLGAVAAVRAWVRSLITQTP